MKPAVFLFAAVSAFAQLQFFSTDGTTESAISGVYTVAPTAPGDTLYFRLLVRNAGATDVPVSSTAAITMAGTGFQFDNRTGNWTTPPTPMTLLAHGANSLTIWMAFQSNCPVSCNSTLRVNTTSITLFGSTANVPNVSITFNGNHRELLPGDPIEFGGWQVGLKESVTLFLENRGNQPIQIQAMTLNASGGGFALITPPAFPLNLNPSEIRQFDLQFAPTSATTYRAALLIDRRSIGISGLGINPVFPSLKLIVDPVLTSAAQINLKLQLDGPAPYAATGGVRLGFTPAAAGGKDDNQIFFVATQSRALAFSVQPGDTYATFGVTQSPAFQTGTTAGTLTFSVDFQGVTNQSKSSIPAQAIAVDATIANRPNDSELDVQINGFDNTRTAGQLAFTFFDKTGATVAPGRIVYDATTAFQQFFQTSTAGGMFSVLARFPVRGSTANIATADVELTNSAGTTTAAKLKF